MNDRFGEFGGRYVPETLIPALDELDSAFDAAMANASFVICLRGRGDKDIAQVAELGLLAQ